MSITYGAAYVAAYVEEWSALDGRPMIVPPPACVESVGRMLDAVQIDGMTLWQAQEHGREAAQEDYALAFLVVCDDDGREA